MNKTVGQQWAKAALFDLLCKNPVNVPDLVRELMLHVFPLAYR